jgi:hypothetical protein
MTFGQLDMTPRRTAVWAESVKKNAPKQGHQELETARPFAKKFQFLSKTCQKLIWLRAAEVIWTVGHDTPIFCVQMNF